MKAYKSLADYIGYITLLLDHIALLSRLTLRDDAIQSCNLLLDIIFNFKPPQPTLSLA
jgi:hypothetical protein